MHFSKLDAYYHLATQGDSEAYDSLYKEFTSKANNLISSIIKNYSFYAGIPADFSDLIDKIFFRVLREYDMNRSSFSSYVEFVFNTRLANNVTSIILDSMNDFKLLDDMFEEQNFIDAAADPNQIPITKDIAIQNFTYKIASPNKSKSKKERIRDKILLLQYKGYTNVEICKVLNITLGQLRGYQKQISKDKDIINFKLEMK